MDDRGSQKRMLDYDLKARACACREKNVNSWSSSFPKIFDVAYFF